jgi:uncharacterized protein (DUF1800 family)
MRLAMADTRAKPNDVWAPYAPTKDAPWDLRRAAHLRRRAGFAATWEELQRDVQDGPQAAIDRLLAGKARSAGVPENFEEVAGVLADTADEPGRLKAWWFYRMLFGPDPLAERLTLLWHNHFATSVEKVDRAAMRRQNQVLRQHCRAPFGELLRAVLRDPAVLIWLDAPSNRKGHPNENLARELMELFTLGIGHYTEKDVQEAARCLTGWTIVENQFRDDDARHDAGDKTVLDKTGKWKGDDLVKMLLEHPATPRRLAWRICQAFMGEKAVGETELNALADGLRQRDLNVGWAVETVLRSRLFFAEANIGTRVVGPAEFVVSSARMLELFDQPPSSLLLADLSARLGQNLFAPPNVGGWPGGRDWLSTQALIGRGNFAAALVGGKLTRTGEPTDPLALAQRHGRARDLDDLLAFFGELLHGTPPATEWRDRLTKALGAGAKLTPEMARRAAALVLASPEAQLA